MCVYMLAIFVSKMVNILSKQRYVDLNVFSIKMVTETMSRDNITEWRSVKSEEQRAQYIPLWYAL